MIKAVDCFSRSKVNLFNDERTKLRGKFLSEIKDVNRAQLDVTPAFSKSTDKLRTDVDDRGRVVLTETFKVRNYANEGKFGTYSTAKVILIARTRIRKLAGVFNLIVEHDPGGNCTWVEIEPVCLMLWLYHISEMPVARHFRKSFNAFSSF